MCYAFVNQSNVSYDDAKQSCQANYSGRLAEIPSAALIPSILALNLTQTSFYVRQNIR